MKIIFLYLSIITSICNSSSNFNNTNYVIKRDYQNTNEIVENEQKTRNENILNYIIQNNEWKLEIPKINLVANIAEGTSKTILDEYVGHFEETQKYIGNVGLAAHNRGYKVNYFEKVKELEIGDIIFYTYNGIKKTYVVDSKTIIRDTQWDKLKNTKDNRLTLITCVENQPSYRRCIQAKENK